jgi:hypothetical protein
MYFSCTRQSLRLAYGTETDVHHGRLEKSHLLLISRQHGSVKGHASQLALHAATAYIKYAVKKFFQAEKFVIFLR